MRAFIAIDLPIDIKNKIKQIQNHLKKSKISVKWVKPENIHLTLKFLGNIEENQIDQIKNIIRDTTSLLKCFRVSLNDFRFFPNSKKPKILFIDIIEAKTLKKIADILEEKLEKLKFKKENHFKAHITLARIKAPMDTTNLLKLIKSISLNENFLIQEIILFQSTLTQSDPIYAEIFKSSLTN